MKHLVGIIQATVEACNEFLETEGRPVMDPHTELDYWAIMARAQVIEAVDEATRA